MGRRHVEPIEMHYSDTAQAYANETNGIMLNGCAPFSYFLLILPKIFSHIDERELGVTRKRETFTKGKPRPAKVMRVLVRRANSVPCASTRSSHPALWRSVCCAPYTLPREYAHLMDRLQKLASQLTLIDRLQNGTSLLTTNDYIIVRFFFLTKT
jgi:hypothetical protein